MEPLPRFWVIQQYFALVSLYCIIYLFKASCCLFHDFELRIIVVSIFLYESDSFFLLIQPLSILCRCFQDIDKYTVGFPRGDGRGQTNIFRAIKHCLPGPVRMIISLSYLNWSIIISIWLKYWIAVLVWQYTFILPATKELPKQCIRSGRTAKYGSRKHVGIRMPDDPICQAILRSLDEPLISTRFVGIKKLEGSFSLYIFCNQTNIFMLNIV